ncbi:uncharacterized protein LOC125431322 [Sphaerodactylus townsendi]|uniref:uncharacterized protein LOC125431322 n=1 Tax=Sphaerodactylus townsendi TaxID=933632 RepID=UPI0020274E93|nr:uncharacterized protein LOC125431322 [Sphaerodactylus townsendi]
METPAGSLFSLSPPPAPTRGRRLKRQRAAMDADDSDEDIFFKKCAKKLFPGSEGDAGPTDQKQTRDACVSTEDGVEQNKHVKMENFTLFSMADSLRDRKSMAEVMRCNAKLRVADIPSVEPSKRRSAIGQLSRATLSVIMKWCLNDLCHAMCTACQNNCKDLNSHDCIQCDFDERLRSVCHNVCLEPIIQVITHLGLCTGCLSLNNSHFVTLAKFVKNVESASCPTECLQKFSDKCNQDFVVLVKKYLALNVGSRTLNVFFSK